MHLLVDAVGFGIAAGAVIAIGAVGFSLQFGMSNVLNITYGALMTLAAYLGLFLLGRGLSAWAAMPLCAALVGLASVGFRRLVVAPLRRRGPGRWAWSSSPCRPASSSSTRSSPSPAPPPRATAVRAGPRSTSWA